MLKAGTTGTLAGSGVLALSDAAWGSIGIMVAAGLTGLFALLTQRAAREGRTQRQEAEKAATKAEEKSVEAESHAEQLRGALDLVDRLQAQVRQQDAEIDSLRRSLAEAVEHGRRCEEHLAQLREDLAVLRAALVTQVDMSAIKTEQQMAAEEAARKRGDRK